MVTLKMCPTCGSKNIDSQAPLPKSTFQQTIKPTPSASSTNINSSTNKNKTVRYLGGADLNGSGHLTFGSILYPFTTAISSIILSADGSFVSGSIMSLYGIK